MRSQAERRVDLRPPVLGAPGSVPVDVEALRLREAFGQAVGYGGSDDDMLQKCKTLSCGNSLGREFCRLSVVFDRIRETDHIDVVGLFLARRVQEEPIEFLGYRIGRNYRRDTGRACIGTRPSAASVQSICRRVSELTTPRDGLLSAGVIVVRLNGLLDGRANYFALGQVGPTCAVIDRHAARQLCRKHKVRPGNYVRFSDERLRQEYGLTRLKLRTASLPWAKA